MSSLDIQLARSQFPGLESGYIFADNAGGSQTLKSVADAAYDYLLYTNAQLGASYPTSQRATARVANGADAAAVLFNAASSDEVAFGPSSTQLLANLARAMVPTMNDGDEIVLTDEHEANVGPWKMLSRTHTPPLPLLTWSPRSISSTNPYALSYTSALPALIALISPRTRIVALSGCSNILGEVLDLETIVKAVRTRKRELGGDHLWVVVDLVAYAPHRCMDVRRWDVDFAAFSFYKLYGPHTATLYTRRAALPVLSSVAHHFHSPRFDDAPFKLQPGGPGYELTYAAAAVLPYLVSLSSPALAASASPGHLAAASAPSLRAALERTSDLFEAHERALIGPLLAFLTSEQVYTRGVRVAGLQGCDARAPTVSFVVGDGGAGQRRMDSREVVERVDKLGTVGIRWGHFYAYSLVASLPEFTMSAVPESGERSVDDGVVRISLVHYNTVAEVERLVSSLAEVLEL